MSSRTSGVAVAVSASTRSAEISDRACASFWYSGLKSCPHDEMQCASSMAKSGTFTPESAARNELERKRSGAT